MAERLRVQVSRISMADYEALHYDKDKLKDACKSPCPTLLQLSVVPSFLRLKF